MNRIVFLFIFVIAFTGFGKLYSQEEKNYGEVTIGNQIWMSENLNVECYRNGDTIPEVLDAEVWLSLTTGAWCYFGNHAKNGKTYGKIYNWYAVNDSRGLAPKGWHIPTDKEWTILTDYLGGEDVAGKKLKSTSGWDENGNGTNESGFTALPGGYLGLNEKFRFILKSGSFWTATDYNIYLAWYRNLINSNSSVYRFTSNKKVGYYVRCVRD